MSGQQKTKFDENAVLEIIKSKNLNTFFQPVVSISTKSIVGFEAYSRGGGGNVCVLDAKMLFHEDLKAELKVDVDRLCRESAFKQFKPIYSGHKSMLLYVNVCPDILPHVDLESRFLKYQVDSMGINFANVVIECTLSRANTSEFAEFAAAYRDFGFKISLDNCSIDDSFSQVVSRVAPDFVKVNRTFYASKERKDYSAKSLDAMVEVVDRAGGVVIAQGVEDEDDSIRLLTAGVHLQQGYYYSKDEDHKTGDPAKMFFRKIIDTYEKFRRLKRELVKRKKERFDISFKAVGSVCSKLSALPEDRFEDACKTIVRNIEAITSIFVVNETGEQITMRAHVRPTGKKGKSAKILGSEKGVDHSISDFVMYLNMGYEKFVTRPFVSPYTGEEVCIISKSFYNSEGLFYVACLEMPYPG